MIKYLLSIILTAFLFLSTQAATPTGIIDIEDQEVSITVNGASVHVTGAKGLVMSIYNVAGVCVLSAKIEGHDKSLELDLPKGCYIMKVGKTVRKISIQ